VPDVAIDPDTKDWTWVLRERCPECGMTAADVQLADVERYLEVLDSK